MKNKLQAIVGRHVTVYAVAEGIAFSHVGILCAPEGFSQAFSVSNSFTSVIFSPDNVKNVVGDTIALNILEPRTHKMVKRQAKQNNTTQCEN